MSDYDWSDENNALLESTRGICFEGVLVCVEKGDVTDIIRHPGRDRYPDQSTIVLNLSDYVWLVPYTKTQGVRF